MTFLLYKPVVCWAEISHSDKNGDCEILNTKIKGRTLSQELFLKQHKELFGDIKDKISVTCENY